MESFNKDPFGTSVFFVKSCPLSEVIFLYKRLSACPLLGGFGVSFIGGFTVQKIKNVRREGTYKIFIQHLTGHV